VLARSQQHLKYMSLKNQPTGPTKEDLDLSSLEQILLKLQKKQTEDSLDSRREVKLVVDTEKKDIGVLIRLYHLQKRLHFIKYVTGEWKAVSSSLLIIDTV